MASINSSIEIHLKKRRNNLFFHYFIINSFILIEVPQDKRQSNLFWGYALSGELNSTIISSKEI